MPLLLSRPVDRPPLCNTFSRHSNVQTVRKAILCYLQPRANSQENKLLSAGAAMRFRNCLWMLASSPPVTATTGFHTTPSSIKCPYLSASTAHTACTRYHYSLLSLKVASATTKFTAGVGGFHPMLDAEIASSTAAAATIALRTAAATHFVYPSEC